MDECPANERPHPPSNCGRPMAGRGGAARCQPRGPPSPQSSGDFGARAALACRATATAPFHWAGYGHGRRRDTMSAGASPVRAYDFLLKFLLVGDSDVGKGEILASLQDGAAESPYGHPAGELGAEEEWGGTHGAEEERVAARSGEQERPVRRGRGRGHRAQELSSEQGGRAGEHRARGWEGQTRPGRKRAPAGQRGRRGEQGRPGSPGISGAQEGKPAGRRGGSSEERGLGFGMGA